jgi:hypothetical protein
MKKNQQYVVQVHVLEINLDVGSVVQPFTLSSAGSTPDNQKYPVDDIKEATPCTLLYVKGRTLRTIEVATAIVLPDHIFHNQLVLSECVVVEVTTIREGHEFEDLDYPNKEEGIEKLKDAKGNFILWPCKDIILKTCSPPIVSPQSKEDEGTPTSNILLRSQEPPSNVLKEKEIEVPPKQQDPPQQQELLVSTARGSASPTQHHSLQQQELLASTARGSPPPEKQSKEPPPPEKQPKSPPPPLENQPKSPPPPLAKQPKGPSPQENPSKGTPPPEQQRTPAGFILNRDAISAMWRSLDPFKQDVEVHEPSKDNTEIVGKFLGGL